MGRISDKLVHFPSEWAEEKHPAVFNVCNFVKLILFVTDTKIYARIWQNCVCLQVNREIVAGLKYHHVTYRKGVKGELNLATVSHFLYLQTKTEPA